MWAIFQVILVNTCNGREKSVFLTTRGECRQSINGKENSTWEPNKRLPGSSSLRRRLSGAIPKRIIETPLEVEGEKSDGLSQIRGILNSHGSNPCRNFSLLRRTTSNRKYILARVSLPFHILSTALSTSASCYNVRPPNTTVAIPVADVTTFWWWWWWCRWLAVLKPMHLALLPSTTPR